ncbi:MAG: hypothetical protein DWQ09_04145 [Proteobacteria bacterium]|nr:MAG: hypothetical protein DWQ09_04145 [Pseudomonadota bacterium]
MQARWPLSFGWDRAKPILGFYFVYFEYFVVRTFIFIRIQNPINHKVHKVLAYEKAVTPTKSGVRPVIVSLVT